MAQIKGVQRIANILQSVSLEHGLSGITVFRRRDKRRGRHVMDRTAKPVSPWFTRCYANPTPGGMHDWRSTVGQKCRHCGTVAPKGVGPYGFQSTQFRRDA